MSRKSRVLVKKSIYQMSMITLVASVIWVGTVVYQSIQDPIDISVRPEMLVPFSPTIDIETINKLSRRRQMNEADWVSLGRGIIEAKIESETQESSGSAVAQP